MSPPRYNRGAAPCQPRSAEPISQQQKYSRHSGFKEMKVQSGGTHFTDPGAAPWMLREGPPARWGHRGRGGGGREGAAKLTGKKSKQVNGNKAAARSVSADSRHQQQAGAGVQ